MKKNISQKLRMIIIIILGLFFILNSNAVICDACVAEHVSYDVNDNLIMESTQFATELKPAELYAKAAVLMDAITGRVLYEKNGCEEMAMASTTKIMTCIIALEYGNLNETVTVSAYAASMPNVKLGIYKGEKYLLRDLLYSLMLESHNDSAVAIAEHIAGSVEGFAKLMNQKARDIGAFNTNFITPNGLDAEGHYTTATDLALIAAYAIKNNKFIEITNTSAYTFKNTNGTRVFNLTNKNSFLNQMEGAFGVKTGYTGMAGYCFVGALKKEGKVFISVVLASGWPPNKLNKWSDTKKLMNYGLSKYSYEVIFSPQTEYKQIEVKNGKNKYISTYIDEEISILINKEKDIIDIKYICPEDIEAPVLSNQTVGHVEIYINDKLFRNISIRTYNTVEKIDFGFCLEKLIRLCVP